MKKNRFVSMILALMLVAVTLTIPAMATEVGSGIAGEIGNGSITYVDDEKESGTNPWVASVIGFFASIICIIIGAIGNRRMMTGGFIGLLASALAYTALNYGKELLELFSMWIVS